jgi:hypothetical protein
MRGLMAGMGIALAAMAAMPAPAHAGPDPEARRAPTGRYRLFAGNLGAITINQLYYGLNTRGEVGVDSTNSSTIGGGYWPKGTGNQYMFNSGLQVAGIIAGDRATNPWAGDTTGGMFFDASGLRQHGTAVTELYNATNPTDVANWPQAAYVPQGDASEELFDPLLRGRVTASQGDVWWMSSEADPGLNAARPHPLGIVAEYRVMGWNYPTGNQDLIYLILTFYNITTTNPAAYAQYRPGVREILLQEAEKFHALNNANFNVSLPTEGYTIDPFYAAFAADPDVTSSAGTNYSSVNMPFAMGYAYHPDFPRQSGWTFSPNIFGAPFFAGVGFVGIKFLKSATGPGEIALFSNTCNGCGSFNDPNSAVRLYKNLSGTVTPADGVSCNQGNVEETRICWVKNDGPSDMRLLESSSAVSLEAGASASIVVAYVHAAPVAGVGGMPGGARVGPGDPVRLTDANLLANEGANTVDSLMGFTGYSDANADGVVQQAEIDAVPGSLLGKAKLAQEIFDNKFLLPFAPDAPDFFLIPGDGQITVVWRPSASEAAGDPFFQVAKDASIVPEGGGAPVVNTLYDPNYRQFDVEGYRIYRGRADNATALKMVAQFDYGSTTFADYTGQVADPARGTACAPEIEVTTSCNGVFDPQVPGTQLSKHVNYPLAGNFVQVTKGNRTQLASGDVIILSSDTTVVGGGSGRPALSDNGVPFIYVDNEVHNGLTYFYAVTAFDVNSITSTGAGNTSLESALITKRIQPSSRSGNLVNDATVTFDGLYGRGVKLTDTEEPTIDPATGIFSKKQPPANAFSGSIGGVIAPLLKGEGVVTIRVDSITLGDPNSGVPSVYHLSAGDAAGRANFTIPLVSAFTDDPQGTTADAKGSASWSAGSADPSLAASYGGSQDASYAALLGDFNMSTPGAYFTRIRGRGCVNSAEGYDANGSRQCSYNGAVWFSGDQQTEANPWRNNYANFNTGQTAPPSGDFTNVGHLPGVVTNFEPVAYESQATTFRTLEGVLGGAIVAADVKWYWGAAGKVDSVIDVTHNVPVPFTGGIGGTWGVLNQSATTAVGSYDQRPGVLTHADFTCVDGFKTQAGVRSVWPCGAASYALSETAVPGPIALGRNSFADVRTRAPQPNNGIGIYLRGHIFLMELEGGALPAAGTVWTMRDYVGAVAGGSGAAGDFGDFHYTGLPRPLTAVGAEAVFKYSVTNQAIASNQETLAKVHTVPDPYYVTSPFEAVTTSKIIKFVNLPAEATVRIYTTSGVLVRVLKQSTTNFGGEISWDVRNRNNQFVASGVYFYHVTAENGETTVGRMTIINYAQ